MTVWISGIIGLILVLLPSLARADATPPQDLALLNQERAAWGLPAAITENATWSSDCAAHDNYERANGGGLTHQEQPGNPGYTTGGAFAGENSVLAGGRQWSPDNNPFENAPIHLIQLFTPSLAQTGIDDSSGDICVTTWPGMTAAPPSQPTVTTYPGDSTTGFLTAEDAEEAPFVPGDFVGLPEGTTAGREIFVYLDEPGRVGPEQVTIDRASLTAPSGPLQLKTVDNSTGTVGPYLTGGIIIPVDPMPEGVPIDASVTVEDAAHNQFSHDWTFTTAKAPDALVSMNETSIAFSSLSSAQGLLQVFPTSDPNVYYIFDQPIVSGASVPTSHLPSGIELQACVSQAAADGYDPGHACTQPFTIPARAIGGTGGAGAVGGTGSGGTASGGTGSGGTSGIGGRSGTKIYSYRLGLSLHGRRVTIFSVPKPVFGRPIRLTADYQRRVCHPSRCAMTQLAARSRTIRARRSSVSVTVPRVPRATRVTITVSASTFAFGGELIRIRAARVSGTL